MTKIVVPEKHPQCDSRIRSFTEEDVEEAFRKAEESEDPHQQEYLCYLYEAAFGWDVLSDERIRKVDGFPTIPEEMWKTISEKATQFDREHHTGVMAGGLWMTSGFSTAADVPEGKVSLPRLKVNDLSPTEEETAAT